MENEIFKRFMERTRNDCRIGKGHLSVFMALYYFWQNRSRAGPLYVYASQVMPVAKIYSRASYHRIVIELNNYGYLKYQPSYFKGKASSINLEV